MKCVKRLTADQQRLAEENLTIVERVLRFDISLMFSCGVIYFLVKGIFYGH